MLSPRLAEASIHARNLRSRVAFVLAGSLGLALIIGLATGLLVDSGHVVGVAAFAGLALPFLFWKVRSSPIVLLMVGAAAVEHYVDTSPDAVISRIPFWRSLSEAGLSGLSVFPVELILVLAIVIWVAREGAAGRLRVPRTQLAVGVGLIFLLALVAWAHGLSKGGDSRIALFELRPFLFFAAAYLLASQLITSAGAFNAVLWAFVLGTGYTGIIGTERVFTLANVLPRPDAILEHDESFFFSLFLVLVVALWVFKRRGALRRVATLLLPFVLTANLGNNRRAAWVILPACLLALVAVAMVRQPQRRRVIGLVTVVLLLISTGYVLAMKDSSSIYGTPAHAIWSQFQPDARDAASNNYRDLEIQNLSIDIKKVVATGLGFGIRFDTTIPVIDVSRIDPLIFYIPHNNVLYIWLRMGALGMFVFWWTMGAAVIAASRLARDGERDLSLFGLLVVAALIAYLVQGWLDVGLVSYRIITFLGCLLGALEAARRLSVKAQPVPSTAQVRSPDPEALPEPIAST